MSVVVTYRIPDNGLGTDFSEFDRPINFASIYTNRFRNITGGAERRPGMDIYASASVPGKPNLTRLHEYVDNFGNETLFSSDDFGNIYKFATSAWTTTLTGKAAVRQISAEANSKLIFVNGVDRNYYTTDGINFQELKALITTGVAAGGTNTTTLIDGNISNWIGATLVSNNDMVFNVTRGLYGIVTTVASAALGTTAIAGQTAGDAYQLVDYVDMNIIPTGVPNVLDNIGTAGPGTNTITIAVSGVTFSTTEIRTGDIVYNTTQGQIAQITGVSANVSLGNAITSQASGDALAFFKSAMPIASWVHVHYGRVYYLDSRNNQRIVISAPDDPQDVTTYQKTLDTTSFSFSSQQPSGDSIISMNTFLSYFVACGKKNLYIYQGNTPIQDTSSTVINFTPIAFYPNGVASRFGLASNGGDLLHITVDGLQAISIGYNAFSLNQNTVSVPIFNTLKNAIAAIPNTDNIQLSYYPRRRWMINKVGDQCYILNTNPFYGSDGVQQTIPSWHLFTGVWAQQNHYFVRRNGDLLSCGPNGLVCMLDNKDATDLGDPIATDLETAWITLEEPKKTPVIKEGHFIRPVFESSPEIEYTINARAGLDNYSSDSISFVVDGTGAIGTGIVGTTPIGTGSFAQTDKYPLRWRGEQVRIEFTTESSAAQDIITSFSIYGNIGGRR